MSTKGGTLFTPLVPLGSTPNLVNQEKSNTSLFLNLFGDILPDASVEIVSRIRVAWVLRKVKLLHLREDITNKKSSFYGHFP